MSGIIPRSAPIILWSYADQESPQLSCPAAAAERAEGTGLIAMLADRAGEVVARHALSRCHPGSTPDARLGAGPVHLAAGGQVVETGLPLAAAWADDSVYHGEVWSEFAESSLRKLWGEVNYRSAVDFRQRIAAARSEGRA